MSDPKKLRKIIAALEDVTMAQGTEDGHWKAIVFTSKVAEQRIRVECMHRHSSANGAQLCADKIIKALTDVPG